MVILLVPDNVYHLIDRIIIEAQLGCPYILRHIDRCPVGTQEQLFVQSFAPQIGPNRTVFAAIEDAFLQSFQDFGLAHQIGLRFVVNLVERHAHHLVSLVETGIHPVVHLLPEGADFRIAGLPFAEHLAGFLHQGRGSLGFFLRHALGFEGCGLFFQLIAEEDVEVANQMVALLARRFRCRAIAPLLPGEHRLANMDATVVHDIGLDYLVAIGLQNPCQAISQQIIADVPQVERLVGVRRRVFHHVEGRIGRRRTDTEARLALNLVQQLYPATAGHRQVQKALDYVELRHRRLVFHQIFADFLRRLLRTLLRGAEERENHQREVPFKLFLRLLQLHLLRFHLGAVQFFDAGHHSTGNFLFNRHIVFFC